MKTKKPEAASSWLFMIGLLWFISNDVLALHLSANTIKNQSVLSYCKEKMEDLVGDSTKHLKVYYQNGRFAAWPANGGLWIWGNEILVCFSEAEHQEYSNSHTYNRPTARNMFARSLDGGLTWKIDDAYNLGITGEAMDHHLGDTASPLQKLLEPIDFSHPDFALFFQRETNVKGPAHFYYSYERGKSWRGPFQFPELDTAGITNRTDYIVEGKSDLLSFLSIGHGRTGVARTFDGGQNWELKSYIGPDLTNSPGYSLMPSSIRLSSNHYLTVIRHSNGEKVWLTSYLSSDNAKTWQRLDDPVSENINSPPAILQMNDGRLVLVYAFRRRAGEASSLCAKISFDNGKSWGKEIVIREKDGANWDVGYPRIVLRPDGKLLVVYYWNHALLENQSPYRYIAASIWDPGNIAANEIRSLGIK